ncbi:MAG: saccharopine dehydrogenase NADP-binding domain-containing protein [Saccharolobus sp.]|jgi:saccharopine dehydrogenase (NAD+, L-lysine-forming)|uniref:saccharopine dehydrogenase NADP-binding domain-containing protein n=1 Tax=Saccharolobus sp. TaxID=2100761 RepID=UPI0028CBDA63|nr:saccharopine dehydrogenase NADP-binding domain-containing protein [Saccharolobus sp.]MDT7862439.1 saccharopine dehydrogenase NADP-binding domain-containing protein [Saccharolobus sp.]
MKVSVIGGSGLVGSVTVKDLIENNIDVKVIDIREPKEKVEYVYGDLNDIDDISRKIKDSDYVINAAQYYFNLKAMEAALRAGVNYIDLGGLFWMTLKQLEKNAEFEREGLLALIGMGAEPGITNVAARYLATKYGIPKKIKIRNGWKSSSSEFKFNWSVDTQMDEMTMDAPVWDHGSYKYYKPLSMSEEVEFLQPVGKVKVYLTIHSELATFPSSFSGVEYVDWMEGGDGFDIVMALGKLFGEDREVLGIKTRTYLKEVLKNKNLIGSQGDEWESAKVIFEYEDSLGEVEVLIPPKGNIDGTQYGAGIPSSIAVQMKVRGKGVLPPEKVIEPETFFKEIKRRGFSILVNYEKRF